METLSRSAQFERVRREGRTWASGLVVLNAAQNGLDIVRCGFITGKKVGKAVERNRARRLIKEAVRGRLAATKPGWDLVWIARTPAAEARFEAVDKAVDDLLTRGRLYASSRSETERPQSRIIDSAEAPQPGNAGIENSGEPASRPERS